MNIVFFGSPEFAAHILNGLIEWDQCRVIGVVTQPDKRAGRGRKLTSTPVKQIALKENIPVFEPNGFKKEEDYLFLKELGADVFVVAAYGFILPQGVLSIPFYGAINVHASLLPKYRGAAPIQWAILNGEKATGITIMQMDEGMDTGSILLQKAIAIGVNDTARDVHDKLAKIGAKLIIKALDRLRCNKLVPIPQESSSASYAPKLSKDMGLIDWNDTRMKIHNKIRALYPWPMAYFYFNTKKGKIKVQVFPGKVGERKNANPGEIMGIRDGFLEVGCGDGTYLISRLKPQSSKVLTAEEFRCGYIKDE